MLLKHPNQQDWVRLLEMLMNRNYIGNIIHWINSKSNIENIAPYTKEMDAASLKKQYLYKLHVYCAYSTTCGMLVSFL